MKKYCFLLKSDSVRVINNRIERILRFIAIERFRYQEQDIESFLRSIVCVQHKIDTNDDKEVFSFFIGYDYILSLRKNDSITTETNNSCLVKYSEITEITIKYGYIEIDLNTNIYAKIIEFLYDSHLDTIRTGFVHQEVLDSRIGIPDFAKFLHGGVSKRKIKIKM